MPFSLHERALYSLLAVNSADERMLMGTLERIEAAPLLSVDGMRSRSDGTTEYVCEVRGFWICYSVEQDGDIFVHDIVKA